MNNVIWLRYEFYVYTPDTTWHDVPGLYIFAGLTSERRWTPLYIGQANSFEQRLRLTSHENWASAVRLGATHIHAMVERQAANRDRIERELIEAYQPTLNVQLK